MMKKAFWYLCLVVLIGGPVAGIGYGVWYKYYGISGMATVCTIADKPVTLVKFNDYEEDTWYFTYANDRVMPSQTVERERETRTMNYYFSKRGSQFLVTWSEQSKSWVISGAGGGWASADGFTFSTSEKVGSQSMSWDVRRKGAYQQGRHDFYLVGSALIKAHSTEAGPNNVYVLMPERAKGRFGPYADTTMPFYAEGRPVYVGWTSKVEERGAERITTNAYVFSWDGHDMPIDCEAFLKPAKPVQPAIVDAGTGDGGKDGDAGVPVAVVDDASYVKVVEPFDAPICGQNAKIGLERRVVKTLVAGQDRTSETLMYSINGQRFNIGVVVPVHNANVNTSL